MFPQSKMSEDLVLPCSLPYGRGVLIFYPISSSEQHAAGVRGYEFVFGNDTLRANLKAIWFGSFRRSCKDAPGRPSGHSRPPSSHCTVRSRSLQPSPVGFVPPRSLNLDFGRCVKSVERQTTPRKRSNYKPSTTYMTYIQEFEMETCQEA